jgi:cytochrome c oxidase subunit 4
MAHEHSTQPGDDAAHGGQHGAPHGASHGVGHVVSPKILIATSLALLVLTVLTVFAANVSFEALEMPELHIIVALGIALLKASLVCLFFMHLRWDRPFNGFLIVASMALVVLFITFALTDSNQYQPDIKAFNESLPEGVTATVKAELDKLPPMPPPGAIPAQHSGGH